MILGFHYHIPALVKDNKIFTAGFLGLFLDSLAEEVEQLVCFMHTPLQSEEFLMEYALQSKNVTLVSLGPHSSVPKRVLTSAFIVGRVKRELAQLDVLLVRCPTPLLPRLASVKSVKKAFLIVGDYEKSSKDLIQPFVRKIAIQLWASINKWQQSKAILNSMVFVNNALIYEELKGRCSNLNLVRTTTLQESDFFKRDDTCNGSTINLLYAGRFDLSKGLLEMIETLKNVRETGCDVNLHFVGWEDRNETIVLNRMQDFARRLGIENFVFFHGRKQVGAELNYYYRMADVYLIGSKLNEGFPRTIWESFANSLPVIASAVGSIPFFLKDRVNAILIRPGDVTDMTSAVLELIKNAPLRQSLIRHAREEAKETTLKIQASKMVQLIKDYLKYE